MSRTEERFFQWLFGSAPKPEPLTPDPFLEERRRRLLKSQISNRPFFYLKWLIAGPRDLAFWALFLALIALLSWGITR